MTSSARASRLGPRLRPRAFADFALMASWKRVGCSMERPPDLVPFKTLSTKAVERLASSGLLSRIRSIGRGQQQQEKCPVSVVFGSGTAAFRTLNNGIAVGRGHAPQPFSATFLQDHLKDLKLIRRHDLGVPSPGRAAEFHGDSVAYNRPQLTSLKLFKT
jgi:hypothetical protein